MTEYESEHMEDRGHKCKKSAQGMGKEFVAGEGGVLAGQFLMFSGADDITVVPCTATGPLIGVAMHDAAVDETVSVQMDGYHWVTVGTAANLNPGDWVVSDANGYAVEMTCPTAGSYYVMGGYILSTPTDDDDCACLKVQPKVVCEPDRG